MSNKIINIINEEISMITKKKDQEIFDYKNLTDSAWDKKVKEAQDFQNIGFDLENDDSTGQKRIFYVPKNLRKDQPVKYQFNAELYKAGGDWEWPVMYFRIQFVTDYGIRNNKFYQNPKFVWDKENSSGDLYNCYVIIPPVEAGNKLFKGEKGHYRAYDDQEITKENKKTATITEEDERNCWKWLKITLEKLVDERHEMLDN